MALETSQGAGLVLGKLMLDPVCIMHMLVLVPGEVSCCWSCCISTLPCVLGVQIPRFWLDPAQMSQEGRAFYTIFFPLACASCKSTQNLTQGLPELDSEKAPHRERKGSFIYIPIFMFQEKKHLSASTKPFSAGWGEFGGGRKCIEA